MSSPAADIHYRRQLFARRRRRLPPAPEALDGIYLINPEDGTEVFIPFNDLHGICRDMMDPYNAQVTAETFGKVDWKQDPTYNLRKERK